MRRDAAAHQSMEDTLSVIKINAITVPADSGDELAHRFAARAGSVDGQPGFEGFELLKPTDGRHVWLVITRWADDASFEAWTSSGSFRQGHPDGPAKPAPESPTSGGPARVGLSAELWSYEPTVGSAGSGS